MALMKHREISFRQLIEKLFLCVGRILVKSYDSGPLPGYSKRIKVREIQKNIRRKSNCELITAKLHCFNNYPNFLHIYNVLKIVLDAIFYNLPVEI